MITAVLTVVDEGLLIYGDSPVIEHGAVLHDGRWDADRGCWRLPATRLRDVENHFDQHGVVWACEHLDEPRHWAQWLFTELPADLHAEVYQVLSSLLTAHQYVLHRHLLDSAWEQRRHDRP